MTGDRRTLATALIWGALTHGSFAVGAGLMVWHMFHGMQATWGAVPWPFAALANLVLLAQFPAIHSLLLTTKGRKVLGLMAPGEHGRTLSPSTYVIASSVSLALLFAFWTPSGVVLYRADGWLFWALTASYAASWGLVAKSIWDAGAGLQSGWIGWTALAKGHAPRYPDLPTHGMFRLTRQPIYLSFALTLWTPPVMSADQLALAVAWTAYCVLSPRLKERRFERLYGERWAAYRDRTPYWLPFPRRSR